MSEQIRILIYRGLEADLPLLAQGELGFSTDTHKVWIGNGTTNTEVGSGGGGGLPPDGTYADIVVSGSGTAWNIGARAVGAAELAAVANKNVLGRNTAGSGDVEQVGASVVLDWLDASPAAGDLLLRGASTWAQLANAGASAANLGGGSNGVAYYPCAPILLSHQEANGTGGGTAVSSTWTQRPLNTKDTDPDSQCTLSSNQFSLVRGIYLITGTAPVYNMAHHQSRLRETTGPTNYVGTSEFSVTFATTRSHFRALINVTASMLFEVDTWTTNSGADGWGTPATTGGIETYTQVEIQRIGSW